MLDVAKKAGVSKATVSRVLNNKDIVKPDLIKRVYDAIDATGYRPNVFAQNLATQTSKFIGLVISNDLFDGPYFSSLMHHAAKNCDEINHQLVMTDGKHSKAEEKKAINLLIDMHCAGIIIYPTYLNDEELSEIIRSTSIPVIVINREMTALPQCAVRIDHYQSSVCMMEHLIQQGHRDIAIIRGPENSNAARQRMKAYIDTLLEHHIMMHPKLITVGDWTIESGYAAANQLLLMQQKFTAVLASNDDMALGAIKAFQMQGIKLPEDISIAGFDDSNMCRFLSPSLSSVQVPMCKIIEKAILLILNKQDMAAKIETNGILKIRESIIKI